jgi:4-amino-4-deoxy-L-arabinose transferase-like glycosyltransferase
MIALSEQRKQRAKYHQALLAPLLVNFLLRLTLMLVAYHCTGTQVMTEGDTQSYLEPGRNLFLHGSLASGGHPEGVLPEIDRTPGYPIFLMLTGMLHENVLLTVLMQIFVSCLSMLLVAKTAERVFPDRHAGVVAAWLYALEPLGIIYTVRVLPEMLFGSIALAAIERFIAFLKSDRLSSLVHSGVLFAAATYVRPVSYYLVFPLAIGLVLVKGKGSFKTWMAAAIFLLTSVSLISLWQIRNYVETGYSGFSSIVEKNLYFYQSAEISAEAQHISLEERQKELGYVNESSYLAEHPEQRAWMQSERLRFMKAESMRVLSQHPGLYARSHFAGVAVVAFTPGSAALLQLIGKYPDAATMPHRILNEGVLGSLLRVIAGHSAVAVTMVGMEGFLLLVYMLAICGSISGRGDRVIVLTLVGICFYFLLISGGAQAVGRYRLPVMPILCVLAAGGYRRPWFRNRNQGLEESG